MKEIVIVSGKGGTGKTSVTAALASLASQEGVVLCDADVDAPDLWLLIPPKEQEKIPFMGMDGAEVNEEVCIGCGKCRDFCRFDAVAMVDGKARIRQGKCEGCAGCTMVCPVQAISMVPRRQGSWYKAETGKGKLVYARLYPGGENSGMLVTTVKKAAEETAKREGHPFVLVDGPPGIACPAIAALTGASLAVAVTEPTESGIHDLLRLHQIATKLDVPTAVVLNKWDVTSLAPRVREVCLETGIPILGEIPFSKKIPEAVASAEVPLEPMTPAIQKIWSGITELTK